MSALLLLVEDDLDLAEAIKMGIEDEGWQVEHMLDGISGLSRAESGEHDLVILDVRLPDLNGFDLCRKLRRTSNIPVLFLTARSSETDKVVGLELGGDDYLAKPFGMRELLARIRALLRRANAQLSEEKRIRVLDLLLLPERQSVYRGNQRIQLTPSEYQVLLTLAQRPKMIFTREMLMEALWQTDHNTGSPLTVNVHVRNLRAKLGDDLENPRYIVSVRGVGYKLQEGEQ
ncbi:response regulator transcription factor [Desulfosporosinus fructosivorans]|uniref:Stage 0 sporulation protein A homolog n=1 Tax=Desulfosporosinus fructosivorans TaxID=2018669 RepID=A0A4Z0R0N7_9FIRM|nr:response regulator transcription factor [Desulfosporosinus fructosivorans]TGE35537.1 response regulator transcription factor [Desulfosporosinus fructosivorans]